MEPADIKLAEFTKEDFDTYRAEMAPYDWIVDNMGMLTPEQVRELNLMKEELSSRYSAASLSQWRISGYIDSILALDSQRKGWLERKKLEREESELEIELGRGATPERENEIHSRLVEIGNSLEPYH